MSPAIAAALKRFARVFIAGALVGGYASLQGDTEFVQYLKEYGWVIPVVAFVGKLLRSKFGWTWLPV